MAQSWQDICLDYSDALHIEREKAAFSAKLAGAKMRKR